jgi:hypothetical protein
MLYICAFRDWTDAPPFAQLFTDDPAAADAFAKRHDIKGVSVYQCVANLLPGARARNLQTVASVEIIHADIDLRGLVTSSEIVLQTLQRLHQELPLEIRASGGGYHLIINLKEPAYVGTAEYERVNASRTSLTEMLCADPMPNHSAALLRKLGTHNTKWGEACECRVIVPGKPVDVTELETFLERHPRPLFERKPKAECQGNGHDTDYSGRFNRDERVASLCYPGNIHSYELQCTASLISSGVDLDDAVGTVFDDIKTFIDAHPPQRLWNWDKEKRRITRMAYSWVNKHPDLSPVLPAHILAEYDRITQNGGAPYLHWSRERKSWWVKDNAFGRASRKATLIIPLAASEWLNRELPPLDPLIGAWMTTTSRILLSADTGLGKTNICMALAAHASAGVDFLHWRAYRPARVLYVDGEMSRRLLKDRIEDLSRRLGFTPEGLHFLSREDVENLEPLNTPAGMLFLNNVIGQLSSIEFIFFDNCMALTSGKQAEEDSWTKTLPLVSSLTKRHIGQLWINHTGHNTDRSYGTKTRDWRMDTTVHLNRVERADTDISFSWEFRKARERTPQNRADFIDVTIALVDDMWIGSGSATRRRGKPSAQENSLLRVLNELLKGPSMVMHYRGHMAIHSDPWQAECLRQGLVKNKDTFRGCRSRLAQKNLIECDGEMAWKAD